MELIKTTNKQVEIKRTPNKADSNYKIVVGNPLNSNIEWKINCNWLKINDFGVSTKSMSIGEYNSEIKIYATNNSKIVSGVNVVLNKE